MALNSDGFEAGEQLSYADLIQLLSKHRNKKEEVKEVKPKRTTKTKSSEKEED